MKPVKIYVWISCPFCRNAIRLFDSKKISYECIELDGKDDELNALRAQTGQRTVPQIFIGDEFIGGFSELSALESSGELDKKLGNT